MVVGWFVQAIIQCAILTGMHSEWAAVSGWEEGTPYGQEQILWWRECFIEPNR